MRPVPYHWDEMKIGPGAPPIKTDQGWLSIYHGVFKTMDGSVYRLGVALHDLHNPAKIIGVGDSWILQPEDPWELTGYVHNVVFTCGAVPESDGTVKIYWGGADTVMCVGEANISDLVGLCLEHRRASRKADFGTLSCTNCSSTTLTATSASSDCNVYNIQIKTSTVALPRTRFTSSSTYPNRPTSRQPAQAM